MSTVFASPPALPLALYVHIPWCAQKCPYCDFNSHSLRQTAPEAAYVTALLADLDYDLAQFGNSRPLQSIFIGGGTPSLFSAAAIADLLDGIARRIAFTTDIEINLEANPGSAEAAKFAAYRQAGVNRLSIGIQTFNDRHLRRLGRIHSGAEAVRAVEAAQQAGFGNLNVDLMFGLPDASLGDSQEDIRQAIALQPAHISFYQLTIEPNTYFGKYPPPLPGDDTLHDTQQHCQALLAAHSYAQYEVSAYASSGFACRHNQNYWRFGDYLGIGAGAHGKMSVCLPDNIVRYWKQKSPQHYMATAGGAEAYGALAPVPVADIPLEFTMNHLRLREGFDLPSYTVATGLNSESLLAPATAAITEGLLCWRGDKLACSDIGWNFLDNVLHHFIK